MPTSKTKPTLSKQRRISWYAASITFGLFLIWFVSEKELLTDPDTAYFELAVIVLCWVAVVVLLRRFVRDIKYPSDHGDD